MEILHQLTTIIHSDDPTLGISKLGPEYYTRGHEGWINRKTSCTVWIVWYSNMYQYWEVITWAFIPLERYKVIDPLAYSSITTETQPNAGD